jgi:hypothetical protein
MLAHLSDHLAKSHESTECFCPQMLNDVCLVSCRPFLQIVKKKNATNIWLLLLQMFSEIVGPLLFKPHHMKNMVNCLSIIVPVSNMPNSVRRIAAELYMIILLMMMIR